MDDLEGILMMWNFDECMNGLEDCKYEQTCWKYYLEVF